jgi:hypothetical protein
VQFGLYPRRPEPTGKEYHTGSMRGGERVRREQCVIAGWDAAEGGEVSVERNKKRGKGGGYGGFGEIPVVMANGMANFRLEVRFIFAYSDWKS